MNNTTRKYPRTLNEAFGPYAHLKPIDDNQPHYGDLAVTVVSLVISIGLVVSLIFGWI